MDIEISKESLILNLAEKINSNDKEKIIESTISIRKLLSVSSNPPIDLVVNIGIIVPRLIKFLEESSVPNLQFESAWCLTNIASGTNENCKNIVDAGVIPALNKLLNSTKELDIIEQVIWAYGCISGDSVPYRDKVIHETNTFTYILNCLNDYLTNNNSIGFTIHSIKTLVYTLGNLLRNKPRPPYEISNQALPILAKLTYCTTDLNILTDTLWGLSYYSNSCPNEIIQKIIDIGICKRLVELLSHPSSTIHTPSLIILCDILAGNETHTQILIDLNILNHFEILLKSADKKFIIKNVCFGISNITAGSKKQLQKVLENKLIIENLILILKSNNSNTSIDISIIKEALWCISNLIINGSIEQVEYLLNNFNNNGIIEILCNNLDLNTNLELIDLSIDSIIHILKYFKKDNNIQFLKIFENLSGLIKLQYLQNHPKEEIYQKAYQLLSLIYSINNDDNKVLNDIKNLNI